MAGNAFSGRPLPGVLYAEDFDLPAERPAAGAPARQNAPETIVLEPTFSLVDIQRATEHALEHGRSLERVSAAQDIEARRADALCQIAAALRDATAENARIAFAQASAQASALARTVLSGIAAMLPRLAESQALPEASALLALLLPAMEGEPKLQIRANPALVGSLRNDLATLAMAGSVELEWIAIDTMEPGDVVVKWRDGAMIRDTRALCREIGMLFDQIGTDPAMKRA